MELKETHTQGFLSVERNIESSLDCDFGIQIAKDGRVWICIDGVAFLRFKPTPQVIRRKIMETRYLGDGVYASFDGSQIWLDLRGQATTTRIALDQDTFNALITYRDDILADIANKDYHEANPEEKDNGA